MIIIGLVGKKRSGKDTFVHQARAVFPDKKIERLAFADPLKEEICIAINSVNARIGSPFKHHITPSYIDLHKEVFRRLLQGWATEYRRNLCGKSYWTEKLLRKLLVVNADIVCIPDMRFINESEMLNDIGGYIVKIIRPNFEIDGDTHVSENEWEAIKPHHTIVNNGGIQEFKSKVKDCLDSIINNGK